MDHVKQIKKVNGEYFTSEGEKVSLFRIAVPTDEELISNWAKHFREQYCTDEELDQLIDGTGKTKGQYLEDLIFPTGKGKVAGKRTPGPGIRSGDFTEVLLSDYLEFTKNYWVPRNRFEFKATRDESVKGSDVLAIKFKNEGSFHPDDVLRIFESKALLSKKGTNTLQNAVNDSGLDYFRVAHTLNAYKRRYLKCGDHESADKIKRFQNPQDNPYKDRYAAVAFCTEDSLSDSDFFEIDTSEHPAQDRLKMFVFFSTDLMKFVHRLYKRAIDEAG